MKKWKLLALGSPLAIVAPIATVACEKPVDHKIRNDKDPNFDKYLAKLKEIKFEDLNISTHEKSDYRIKDFFREFIYDSENFPIKTIYLKEDAPFYKDIDKAAFQEKYAIFFSADIFSTTEIQISAWLAPADEKEREYLYNGTLNKNYFFYERHTLDRVSGFKGHDEIVKKEQQEAHAWNLIRIIIPTVVAVIAATIIIVQIIRHKKKKGIKKYHHGRKNN
ncbi:Uncharacterised protein [Metamycoplasma cloacale]|uniref:Uncharacterized protein n=1 Tax=Metamycoplasma cloacale TaxID=92401 RepID=A0A2Z4LMH2_9BACT|nr:hypothetical protein [Metamycoplasma cloacale]AWX42983.1 hypothetical protein DK849_02840 [Metamycoplasma cloacale]VEU79193.1 Uncharacterised protein [Metamycoplasma cloacale]